MPWWGWVLVVLGALTLLDALDGGLIPLIILGVIGWKVFGKQLSAGGGPWNRVPPGDRPGSAGAPPADRPPAGSSPAAGQGWADRPGGPPPPMPTIDVPHYPGSSASSGSSALSLLRLQLAQAGRDLEQALAAGDAGRAQQLLEGMDRLLAPGRDHGGTERALQGDVRAALSGLAGGGGDVDRAVLDRVVARCRAMGQTGHHE